MNACGSAQRWLFPACALVLLLVCGQGIPAQTEAADGRYQQILDQHGIDYRIPPAGKAILVNIPAFELIAFRDGAPVLRSPVIVGTPWHPTPLLEVRTTRVRFRPTWRPTASMVASGEYRDRVWPPGEGNPLGLAAIHLQDGLPIYLHDTNRRELFDRPERALSHGCIRVQAWDRLVAFVLDMPVEQVHRLANGNRTLDVEAPAIPVSVRYLRRFVGSQGQVVRYPDVYGRERASATETDARSRTCDAAG